MQALLIPLDGSQPIPLTRDVIVVGRKPGLCDLIVDRNSISKLHCLLVKTDGLLFVRDLGSTNGTRVNGQRVIRGALLPGDELAFASVKFRVHLGPDVSGAGESTEMLTHFPDESAGLHAEDFDAGASEPDQANSHSDVRLLSDDSVE